MSTTAAQTRWNVAFHAEIAWLGPIMGAAHEHFGQRTVTIVGAEDPALGRSFACALVPVTESDGHFHQAGPYKTFEPDSDVYGWFAVEASASLWATGAKGVLVVLLYSLSGDLQYYTWQDVDSSVPYDPGAPMFFSRVNPSARVLAKMDDEMKELVKAAIADEIKELLRRETAETLHWALAERRMPNPPADSEANDTRLAFAIGSCQYPTAMLEHEVSGASYARLDERIARDGASGPQCLLLLGDQIYVDGTAGLFDPTSQFDRYVRPYQLLFRMPQVRNVLRRLPVYTMMDDHEIVNNWEPGIDERRPDPAMIDGRHAYVKFQRRAGPDLVTPVGDSRFPLWYPFEVGRFRFFMADTRTERTSRTARTIAAGRIMSEGQMSSLLDWLSEPSDMPRIIASPSILLPRHSRAVQRKLPVSALRSDGWDGYPGSLHQVLAYIAHQKIRNVVFVSGDEHLSCLARIELARPEDDPVVVHSVHCSPLFAPFPFANSEEADLVPDESFALHGKTGKGARYRCRVRTEFGPPGDGFAVLRFHREDGGWKMYCEFDRAHEEGAPASTIECNLA